jgi:hypothetical protein
VVTIGGQIMTENSDSAFVIGSQTIVPGGPAITVSGTRMSVAPGATDIIIGTQVVPIGGGVNASPTDTAIQSAYTGPIANGAARVNCICRELLVGIFWAVWWGSVGYLITQ